MNKEILIMSIILTVILIGVTLGLYSIKDKHYGITNVCNEQFYPDLCGSPKEPEKTEENNK